MRSFFLKSLLGKPWKANATGPDAYDCWHGSAHVQQQLFNRVLPFVKVPQDPSWRWMIDTIQAHPEYSNWVERPLDKMGLVTAHDGALVLMARSQEAAHIGTWLEQEQRVIHVDATHGVVIETLADLKMKGWNRLRFYDPI